MWSERKGPINQEQTIYIPILLGGGLVSPSQQCSSTPVSFGQRFLGNEYVTTLDHPPYSPDLAPADFYLFTRVKLALKGQCFCDAKDIMKTMTEVLKRLSKNYFQECFQHLYSCYQKCTVAKGDYFEGNIA
jgi:hypothetical protein